MSGIRQPTPEEIAAALAQPLQPQPATFQVAVPINDVQLITLAAAHIYDHSHGETGWLSASAAVDAARRIFVEAVAQEEREPLVAAIRRRIAENHPSEPTPAGQQYIMQGVK